MPEAPSGAPGLSRFQPRFPAGRPLSPAAASVPPRHQRPGRRRARPAFARPATNASPGSPSGIQRVRRPAVRPASNASAARQSVRHPTPPAGSPPARRVFAAWSATRPSGRQSTGVSVVSALYPSPSRRTGRCLRRRARLAQADRFVVTGHDRSRGTGACTLRVRPVRCRGGAGTTARDVPCQPVVRKVCSESLWSAEAAIEWADLPCRQPLQTATCSYFRWLRRRLFR
jgi:hypothetical protein